jgi:hypothetical protein
MELVERYLQAVRFWLPGDQKEDIIAELAEDLRAQVEDKGVELGHQPSEADIELILKRCGSPIAVAQRYLPKRSLIGPALFPIYRIIVRSLFFYFLLPWLSLWIAVALFSPDFRADHPGVALFASLEPWWLACTYSLFFCTLAFAFLERSQERSHLLDTWNPRSLPVVRERDRISRGATIFELTTSVAALALWFELGAFRRSFHLLGVDVTLARTWPYFFWALMVLGVAGIGLACLNLATPRWTRFSASLRLGIDCYMWALAYLVCRANLVQSFRAGRLSDAEAARLASHANWVIASCGIWVIVIGVIALAFDVRRVLRLGSE